MITLRLYKILKQIIYKINILNKNKIEIVKLWENASPTSAFAGQKISLNLTDYDGVFGYFKSQASSSYVSAIPAIAFKGKKSFVFLASRYMYERDIEAFDDTGITFSDSFYFGSYGQAGTTGTGYCIPVIIYGFKGVL